MDDSSVFIHAVQSRRSTHRRNPKAASKLKGTEYSFRSWYLPRLHPGPCWKGQAVWVPSRTGEPPVPQKGGVTLHPKMIWAHDPQGCPWAEERTGITEECLKPALHCHLKEGYSQHLILVNKSSGLLKFLSYSLWCCSCEYLDAGSSAGHWHLSGIIHIVKNASCCI